MDMRLEEVHIKCSHCKMTFDKFIYSIKLFPPNFFTSVDVNGYKIVHNFDEPTATRTIDGRKIVINLNIRFVDADPDVFLLEIIPGPFVRANESAKQF